MKRLASVLLAVPLLLAGCSHSAAEPGFQPITDDHRQEMKDTCNDAVQGEVEDNANHSYGKWEQYEDWEVDERRTDGVIDTYIVSSEFIPNKGIPITFSCQIDRSAESGALTVQSTIIANPGQPEDVIPSTTAMPDEMTAEELSAELDKMLGISDATASNLSAECTLAIAEALPDSGNFDFPTPIEMEPLDEVSEIYMSNGNFRYENAQDVWQDGFYQCQVITKNGTITEASAVAF